MNQLFKLQNEKTWKTLLLSEDTIMIVNKSYNSPEEFVEKFHEKGLLKERLEIAVADVSKMVHAEKEDNTLTITYPQKNSDTTLLLVFTTAAEKQQFIETVAKPRNMTTTTQQVTVLKAIGSPLLGLGLSALFTYVVFTDAQIIEAGGEVDTSGRKSLYKKLFTWLADMLGTQGSILAGVAMALVCSYFIYKNLRSRPVEIVYS